MIHTLADQARLRAWRGAAMPARCAVVVALMLLAACTSAPTTAGDEAAASPVLPAAWQALPPDQERTQVLGPPLEGPGDWQRLNDPLLVELIAAAQQASPTLVSAAARIERARATRAAAHALQLPTLDAVANVSQTRTLPRGGPTASATVGVQSSWELDLFGGAAAGLDAAQARVQGAQAGWHDARLSVAAEVASGYVALRACEAQLVQTQADAHSRAETARLTELSARAGFTSPADAALARASQAQARNQVLTQAASCDTLTKSLVELTASAEPELRLRLQARTAILPQPSAFALDERLPASLLARRPDLVQAERNVVAAAGDRIQTQARERPSVSLSGSLSSGVARAEGLTVRGVVWSFGPLVVDFPLFDAGRRAADTAAARAAYDEALAQYRALARRAVREVESALVALRYAGQAEADALSAAQDFEISLRATAERQRGGLANLFELEAARRDAVAAQSALIDLRRERAQAWITLVRALGGGWDPARLNLAAGPP